MTDTDTDTETAPDRWPHMWPACPWPGWALLYARMIRDARELDPGLIVEAFEPGSIHPSDMRSSLSPVAADAVFDRIDEAERLAEVTCVICGGAGTGWPPLCEQHSG